MEKPIKETVSYYDIDQVLKYIRVKYGFIDTYKVLNYWIDSCGLDRDEFVYLSDWELMYKDGEFSYMVKKWYKPYLLAILDEFGESDTGCTTPGSDVVLLDEDNSFIFLHKISGRIIL
jgi:hypothetical protein